MAYIDIGTAGERVRPKLTPEQQARKDASKRNSRSSSGGNSYSGQTSGGMSQWYVLGGIGGLALLALVMNKKTAGKKSGE